MMDNNAYRLPSTIVLVRTFCVVSDLPVRLPRGAVSSTTAWLTNYHVPVSERSVVGHTGRRLGSFDLSMFTSSIQTILPQARTFPRAEVGCSIAVVRFLLRCILERSIRI